MAVEEILRNMAAQQAIETARALLREREADKRRLIEVVGVETQDGK